MKATTQATIGAVVADAVATVGPWLTAIGQATGVPIPSNTAGALVTAYLARRQDEARAIVIEELAAARVTTFEAASQDETVAVTLRILRAANEGAARINLRLLAKAVAGQLSRGQLVADQFRQHADILSSLRREEIIVLAGLHRERLALDQPGGEPVTMDPQKRTYLPCERVMASRCDGAFADEGQLRATMTAAQRTGLLMGASGWDGAELFCLSPIFDELVKLVDFQDALRREGLA